jgi:hypothetical protein
MRSAILFYLFVLCLIQCSAQDSTELKYIEERIRKVQPNNEVYYSDYSLQDYYKDCRKKLNRIVLGYKGDTLYLSKTEIRYIKRKLRERAKEEFADSLFSGSRRKPKDSIVQIVERLNKSYIDSLRSLPGPTPSLVYFQYWAFSFCRPVYLRNTSWMVFYFMYYANNGGEHGLAYYRKGVEGWELFKYVCGGAW